MKTIHEDQEEEVATTRVSDPEEEVATTRGSAFDLMVASVAFVGDDDAPGGALACVAPMSTSRASAAAPPVVVVGAPADPDGRSRRRARGEGGEASFRRAASGAASDDPEYGLFDALRAVASLERASDAPFPPLPRVVAAEDVDARTRGAADASGCSRIFALGTVFEEEEEDAFEEEDDALEEEDANARDGGGSRRGIPAIPAAIPAAAPVPGGTTRASAPRAGSAPLARRSRRLALLSFDAASATAACVAAGDARSAARRGDLRRVDADAGLSLALDLDERTLAAVGWEESEPAFDRRGRNRSGGGRLGRRLVVAQATPRGVRAFACAFASLFPPPRDAAACGGTTGSGNNVNRDHGSLCAAAGNDCNTVLCTGGNTGPLCDGAEVDPGFGTALCPGAGLIDQATDLGYDLNGAQGMLFNGGAPDTGGREAGATYVTGGEQVVCP